MLGTARVGLGMLALRRAQGFGIARPRIAQPMTQPQRGLKLFPRFFGRMLPLQQQQHTNQTGPREEREKQQEHHKHTDTGIGMFGLEASGGVQAIIAALVGTMVVFIGGVAYVRWYKWNVLNKIEAAFAPGYDPALALANHPSRHSGASLSEDEFRGFSTSSRHMERKEQEIVDSIMEGHEGGHYFLFMGPKGSGKTTMIIDAMTKVNADGVAVCEAHPDLEVFRHVLRLGKALNYQFNEDSQRGVFQRRDPREGGPRLDIERAMNKLEKVAIKRAEKTGRPIVLVFNKIHLFNNDSESKLLLQQLQQKAESWAESHIATMVFVSDDFWPYPFMRQIANRMHTRAVKDLLPKDALRAFRRLRKGTLRNQGKMNDPEDLIEEAARASGGRLSYMSRLARSKDMRHSIDRLKEEEKSWLLTNAGLIPDCDDDVVNEQKWSSCTWLLLREFVKRREEQEAEAVKRKEANPDAPDEPLPIPSISYYEVRQIMTRADFVNQLDQLNIISIDTEHNILPNSMVTLEAAREVVNEEGFDELLEGVRDRIDEIESLHRTRELTFKDIKSGDRIRVMVDKGGSGWKLFNCPRFEAVAVLSCATSVVNHHNAQPRHPPPSEQREIMGSDLVMGTPQAVALQAAIQKELVAKGYSDESDLVMAEYITIMLINSKTAEQITNELVDLVGPEYDTSFTSWLFNQVATISGSSAGGATEAKPSAQDAQSSTPNQASSEPVNAPSPGQKRRADGRSPSPASKARRTTDLPDRPRAMRDGPSNNEPQPVRSLLDRVEPREPRRHGGFDHVQAQIDSVTRGGHHGGRMMGGRGGGMGMNGHHHQQQQQQMMMQPMMGGVNPMMFQEIMANQMALMSQMAANMGMIQGAPPMMGPGGPGFGFPNGHGQGPHMNGRGRGRGGRGGNMGDRPPTGGPQQQGPSQTQQSPQHSQPTQAIASPQPRPPQPAAPFNVPARPQSPTLCKFGIKCTNAACRYSHPSAEGGLVLSSEYCEKGLECKDADCTKGHPSPAAANGVPAQVQALAPQPRQSAPTGGIPCKFGAACTRPGCTFIHPQKGGKPCRFGINCTRADCTFDHPPGRVLPGSAPQKSAHKSMTFRANPSAPTMQSGPVSKKFGPGGVQVGNTDGVKKTEEENGGDEEDVEAALAGV